MIYVLTIFLTSVLISSQMHEIPLDDSLLTMTIVVAFFAAADIRNELHNIRKLLEKFKNEDI